MSLDMTKPNKCAPSAESLLCTQLVTIDPSLFGPRRVKTCLREFANNKDADQPAHPRSLIIAFVIRLFESTISSLATSEISNF